MRNFIVKIGKVLGYIVLVLVFLWACKEVFFTSVEKSNTETPSQFEHRLP